MRIPGLELALERLPAPLPIWRACVDADAWQVAVRATAQAGPLVEEVVRALARRGAFPLVRISLRPGDWRQGRASASRR